MENKPNYIDYNAVDRASLIEWVEKNWSLIPHDIACMRTYARPISDQPIHILRLIKTHTLDRGLI